MDEKKKYYSEKDVEAIFDSESMVVVDMDNHLTAGIYEERVKELLPGLDVAYHVPVMGNDGHYRFGAQTRPGGPLFSQGERVSMFTLTGFKRAAAWYNLTMLEKEIRAAEFASGSGC